MNCSECKNLIRELLDSEKVLDSVEAVAHLQGCRDCQNFMQYEKALLKSFNIIANEPPPPSLALRVMAIQNEQPADEKAKIGNENWLIAVLRNLFTKPMLQVAITACLTGFFAAIILMRTIYAPVPLVDEADRTVFLDKPKILSTTVATETKGEPQQPSPTKTTNELTIASIPQASNHPENEAEQIAIAADDRIPGAVSFALSEEFAKTETTADAPESMPFEPMPQLAMAIEKRKAMSPTMRMSAKSHETFIGSMGTKESEFSRQTETSDGFAAAPPVLQTIDPRSIEISELLEKHDLNPPDGFINIDDLAMRGFLGTAQLKKMKPPVGSGWFLTTIDGKKNISLKKR